ncbi:MAG: hypothetical protein ACFFG0_03915 [Candidatus Thorarchaeota archaeon]
METNYGCKGCQLSECPIIRRYNGTCPCRNCLVKPSCITKTKCDEWRKNYINQAIERVNEQRLKRGVLVKD